MAEEENALALFLTEYSCAQLFAFLLIKHGCTSLIDHGKLLHTLMYLCKEVYNRSDRKELYNRFFKQKRGIHILLQPRCKHPLVKSIILTREAVYTVLKENGNPDDQCTMVVYKDKAVENRDLKFRNGKRVGLQRHYIDGGSVKTKTYHENGRKKEEIVTHGYQCNTTSDKKREWNEHGQPLRHWMDWNKSGFKLDCEWFYDNNFRPPNFLYRIRYLSGTFWLQDSNNGSMEDVVFKFCRGFPM